MKQSTAFTILQSGHNVFLTGSAGTGKTHLLRRYIRYLRERKVYPTVVAPTGIAASHLKGQTIHSTFALGIYDGVVDDGYVERLLEKKYLKSRFKKLQILIIDEISMVSPELFTSMDKILKAFKRNSLPFGGIQVVISGDFFQLPPVSRDPGNKRFAWQAAVWKALDLKSCYLQEKYRQADMRLIILLDEIRMANISPVSQEHLHNAMHTTLTVSFTPTKLYTHNIDVDRINNEELRKLPTAPREYHCTSEGSEKNVERIFKTSLVLPVLVLKKDAVVLFIKNNMELGYVNGTTGVVTGFDGDLPLVQTTHGTTIRVHPEEWSLENERGESLATVTQLPLRLAWAMTIHKSQGMTLDAAEIDLSRTFETGQGYVALSRLKSLDGLRLMGLNDMALRVDPLSLRIDAPIQNASKRAEDEIAAFSEEELEKQAMDHIRSLGGLTDFVEIEKEKKRIHTGKPRQKSTTPTHLQTKALIDASATIQAMAEARGMTEGTIINHLAKIKEEDPDCDLDKFKPEAELLQAIEEAYHTVQARNNPDDFSENGMMRLKPLYEMMDGRVSYDMLRLAMLFVDTVEEDDSEVIIF